MANTTATRDRAIARIQAALSAFQSVNQTMPIQIAATFLLVASREGRSLREYCDLSGVVESTMSRHLLDLGARNRRKEPGYGLIEVRTDNDDLRKNVYKLTSKGINLLNTVISIMEK